MGTGKQNTVHKSQKVEGYKRIHYLLEIKNDLLTGGNMIMLYIRQQKTREKQCVFDKSLKSRIW